MRQAPATWSIVPLGSLRFEPEPIQGGGIGPPRKLPARKNRSGAMVPVAGAGSRGRPRSWGEMPLPRGDDDAGPGRVDGGGERKSGRAIIGHGTSCILGRPGNGLRLGLESACRWTDSGPWRSLRALTDHRSDLSSSLRPFLASPPDLWPGRSAIKVGGASRQSPAIWRSPVVRSTSLLGSGCLIASRPPVPGARGGRRSRGLDGPSARSSEPRGSAGPGGVAGAFVGLGHGQRTSVRCPTRLLTPRESRAEGLAAGRHCGRSSTMKATKKHGRGGPL